MGPLDRVKKESRFIRPAMTKFSRRPPIFLRELASSWDTYGVPEFPEKYVYKIILKCIIM